MTEELVEIEVDGQTIQARKGSMLIEATDAAGIDVPRFCYHKKLSVVANCRMCLVDVEKAPKPLPACATPVAEGMKVRTNSARALDAQRGTMEFLLINHPLDCPVCDQGGECELQDLSLGYGEGISRFTEGKRAVADEDLGPLIATDMTRCIHCTRCVRFGTEIAGVRELGATGRGEDMRIGTYVGRMVSSELSGNVIDLCPVGALTNKPARYTFRPWELVQRPSVTPHDIVGSNVFLHERLNRVMRAVPRENEALNETWLADRDRYSHFGMYAPDRVDCPLVKRDGVWEEVDWEVAFAAAVDGLRETLTTHGGDALASLVAPTATLEEQYLMQRLTRELGSPHIDHRLRQYDFSDDESDPVMPWLGQSIAQLEEVDAALLIGSNVRKEQPLIGHRLRKAVVGHGARICFVNARHYEYQYEPAQYITTHPARFAAELAGIGQALSQRLGVALPAAMRSVAGSVKPTAEQVGVAEALAAGETRTVLLGSQAIGHPDFSRIRRLAHAVATLAGARLGYLPEGGNACGAWLAGCVPHRGTGGRAVADQGLPAAELWRQPRRGYLLYGVEPEFDASDPAAAVAALQGADHVVAITPFFSDAMLQYADVILPAATFAETDGAFVNGEGLWQHFAAAAIAPGEARPGWKILRMLGKQFGFDGFSWLTAAEVRKEIKAQCLDVVLDNRVPDGEVAAIEEPAGDWVRFGDVPIYSVDSLVRRSRPLQEAADARDSRLRINPEDARKADIETGQRVRLHQEGRQQLFDVEVDAAIPAGCVWLAQAGDDTASLGSAYAAVTLEPVEVSA